MSLKYAYKLMHVFLTVYNIINNDMNCVFVYYILEYIFFILSLIILYVQLSILQIILLSSIFQLESWFKTGATKKPTNTRPTSVSMARPNSETDIVDPDEEYLRMVSTMSESEINKRIEELLVSRTPYFF